MLEPLWPVQGYGITYEAANVSDQASPHVLTFHGNIDSYLVLTNTGGLTVTSFTWAAKVFPENLNSSPLFVWVSDTLSRQGTVIFIQDSKIYIRVHHDGATFTLASTLASDDAFKKNAWNDVAVSYSAQDGKAQVFINGAVNSKTLLLTGAHSTYGDVVIGSRYHYSKASSPDRRALTGKIACMRVWTENKDLTTLFPTQSLCRNK